MSLAAVPPSPPLAPARVATTAACAGSARTWHLARNCSISPGQLVCVYGLLCAVSLGIAGGFAVHGAPWVLGFACIELTAVAAALLVWARHACDGETVTLGATHVDIERRIGGMTEHLRLPADWLRVDRDRGDLVRLGHGDRATSVGRFVPHARREGFVRELRDTLAARRQP